METYFSVGSFMELWTLSMNQNQLIISYMKCNVIVKSCGFVWEIGQDTWLLIVRSLFSFVRYEQAEFIERELEHMTEQIKAIINTINTSQVSAFFCPSNFPSPHYRFIRLTFYMLCKGGELEATDGMTPLDIVVRILNNQLSSLVWIDEKVCILYRQRIFFSSSSPLFSGISILPSYMVKIFYIQAEEFASRIQKLASQGSVVDRETISPKFWLT